METFLKYKFKNPDLLGRALTHSSFAHERKRDNLENNERLEFLGDAVLELVISDFIFNNFSGLPEGELTKLRASIVCESMLAKAASDLSIGKFIRLGKGEGSTGGRERDSILADAFEAIIGAIYLDGGMEAAGAFIIRTMKDYIFEMRDKFKMSDCKTYLQELIQKNSKDPIEYNIIKETGPDHNKVFIVGVTHGGRILGQGEGKSKKEAEQNAAYSAIKKIEKK